MDLGIHGKKALITGAGGGIGKAIALALAKEGVKIAAVSKTESHLNELLEDLGGAENGHYKIICDLMEEKVLEDIFEDLKNNFGLADIVINNVGGTLDIKDPFCSVGDWRKVLKLNLEIAIELNNLIIPHMREKKWGRIVNISSISSKENQGPVPYCSAKAALNAYTRSMGRILAPEGIIVSAVAPGATYTKGGYWDTASQEYLRKYVDERMAIKRLGKPEEIASAVVFLCSEQASFCVGSLFPIDGGQGKCFF